MRRGETDSLRIASFLCAFLELVDEKSLVGSLVVHLDPPDDFFDLLDVLQVGLVCFLADHVRGFDHRCDGQLLL